jgi:hypothetical protein
MRKEQIILKLQCVRSSTRSEANKQLLTECIDALQEDQREQDEQKQVSNVESYYVRQRLKLRNDVGIKLTEEGKAMRFLVNTIDEPNKRLWVVDEAGRVRPQWIQMQLVEPADD